MFYGWVGAIGNVNEKLGTVAIATCAVAVKIKSLGGASLTSIFLFWGELDHYK